MKLVRSNRTERLADALADRIRNEPLGPFEKEVIVVQSRGMERWLTLELSKRLGIWSNPAFPFPRAVVEDVLRALDEGSSEKVAAYDPSRLKWTIAELLHESAPAELRAYLGLPADADRALRLSSSLASVFDDYAVFRPQLLASWAGREDEGWQSNLWRRVAERLGPHDLASRIERALRELHRREVKSLLPFERLQLFSLETLPPAFLALFTELSRQLDTSLYLLEPSSQYLGDADRSPTAEPSLDGHAFLAEAGRLSRDFQQLLLDVSDSVSDDTELFEMPARQSLLSSVQADIFEFRSPAEDGSRVEVEGSDQSISLHACAGPMREAQVLHDLIGAALESDASLEPEDIVVMTPDIETYAPVFRAVFGQHEGQHIPYEVHDRRTREDAGFFDDFMSVLEVLESRFSVQDLVSLIDAGSMREAFRFTQDERARLTELLSAAGARWGVDAEHRAELGFPAESLHTWRAAFGRLFLGFASEPNAMEVFEGLLPRGEPTLADAELLARMARLCEILFDARRETRGPMRVERWADVLERLTTALFEDEDRLSPAAHILRKALAELRELGVHSNYAERISLATVRRELNTLLVRGTPAVGYLRRGVTLTELIPLRSVPFRVVCLVGMSEDEFPRSDDRPSFDLMRGKHKRGDRNKRHDDRHTFLQALLCARDRLIVTYSAPANSLRTAANPSPVVWELSETVNRYYQRDDGTPALEATEHPLHAFDTRYFDGGDLPQSASERYLSVARGLTEPPEAPGPLVLQADHGEEPDPVVSVKELSRWLWNPLTEFIDKVLRARFGESELYEPTSALTRIGPLEKSSVGNGALRAGLEGDALGNYLAAAPEFPDGTGGALERRSLEKQIKALRKHAKSLGRGEEPASELLSLELGGAILEGVVDGVFADRRVVQRFTKAERRAEVEVWVEHLLLNAATEDARCTHLVLRDDDAGACVVTFEAPDEPRALLEELVEVYRASWRLPAPLLESASRAFAARYLEDEVEKAIKDARKALEDRFKHDARLEYLFGDHDPFADEAWLEEFRDASLLLYRPLLAHRSAS